MMSQRVASDGVKSEGNPSVVLERLSVKPSISADVTAAVIVKTPEDGAETKEAIKQLKKPNKRPTSKTNDSQKSGKPKKSRGNVDKQKSVNSSVSDAKTNEAEHTYNVSDAITGEKVASGKTGSGSVRKKSDGIISKPKAGGFIDETPASMAKSEGPQVPKKSKKKSSNKSDGVVVSVKTTDAAGDAKTRALASGSVSALPAGQTETNKAAAVNSSDVTSASKPQKATNPVNGESTKVNRKRSASATLKDDSGVWSPELGSQLHVNAEANPEVASPTAKSQKIQQSGSGASQANCIDEAVTMNVASVPGAVNVSPQQMMNNCLSAIGGIGQRGRAVGRRGYANVGNRAFSATDSQRPVSNGGELPVFRGGGVQRPRRSRSVGFTGVGRGTAVLTRGAAVARRGANRGMPSRGRGSFSQPNFHSEMLAMKSGSVGVGDGRIMNGSPNNASVVSQSPVAAAGSAGVGDSQVSKLAPPSASMGEYSAAIITVLHTVHFHSLILYTHICCYCVRLSNCILVMTDFLFICLFRLCFAVYKILIIIFCANYF